MTTGKRPLKDRRRTNKVLRLIAEERDRQVARWGDQSHPDRIDLRENYKIPDAALLQAITNKKADAGVLTWLDILLEEVAEAADETFSPRPDGVVIDNTKLIAELVQVAGVITAWVEDRMS